MQLTSGQRVLIAGILADDGLAFADAVRLADKIGDALGNLERRGGEDRSWREVQDAAEVAEGWNRADEIGRRQ